MLKAYNGFEAGHAWIDLEPLMELRIETAYYEPGAPRSGLAGFLGTEVARYADTSQGLDLLSVQPMKNRPNDEAPVQDLIAKAETKFSHYRLYYEIVFAKRDHSHGSVLLGADSQTEIDALSAQLSHPEAVCYQRATHCTVFREACSVSVITTFFDRSVEELLTALLSRMFPAEVDTARHVLDNTRKQRRRAR